MTTIYLDYGSSAPTMPDVAETMIKALAVPSNPSAPHTLGQSAASVLESARSSLLENLGKEWRVIFTSSCTEANNIIMNSYNTRAISALEHKSIAELTPQHIIPTNKNGIVDLNHLADIARLLPAGAIVSVTGCNSETGIIQPLQDIISTIRSHSKTPVAFHTDLAQIFTKTDMCLDGIDAFSISGHKIGAPQGVAALIFNDKIKLKPFIRGGGQEYGLRSGTQNIAAIAALGFLLQYKRQFILDKMHELGVLQDYMEEKLTDHNPNVIIVGKDVARAPNISCIITPGVSRKKQMIMFDMHNICVSFGSSCAAGGDEPSPALLAMGYNDQLRECAIRVSTGWNTTKSDIDNFISCWKKICASK